MKRALLAGIAALALTVARPVKADLPVIDFANMGEWLQQLQAMGQQLAQVKMVLGSLTSIPSNLMQQVQGLLSLGVSNPLQDVQGTLSSLMNGGSLTGTCASAGGSFLSANQYSASTGSDFMGSWLNAGAYRNSGVMSCVATMMRGTQSRLDQMPELLQELQACSTESCATAISGRIQLETATISAQQQQAILVGQTAQMQRWAADDQLMQKMRSDSQAVIDGARMDAGASPAGSGFQPMSTLQAPVFNAANFGGGGG